MSAEPPEPPWPPEPPGPPEPQAVLAPLTRAALVVVAVIEPGGEQAVRDTLADVSGLVRAVGFRALGDQLSCVVGIGSAAWDRLFAGPRPAELRPFTPLHGRRHHAPATPGDLLLHLRAQRMDLCFELASLLRDQLGDAVRIVDETQGFGYFDQRDLLGFVDGTESPTGPAGRAAGLVGAADPAFAGGSYAVIQKYLHDLTAWRALSVGEQERVIGRSKLADVEMPDAEKPADSHVALNTLVDEDGTQPQILRLNMPFGSIAAGEAGTLFLGYSGTPNTTERMLRNMFLGNPVGTNYDRILDFSTAITGSLFFVPSADLLDNLPAAPEAAATADPAPAPTLVPVPAPPRAPDGSLGIGSLR